MNIRPLSLDDRDAVLEIRGQADRLHREAEPGFFAESEPQWDLFHDALDRDEMVCFVVEDESEVVGYAVAQVDQSPDRPFVVPRKYCSLHELAVEGGHRRRGFGTALLDTVRGWAQERDCSEMELVVWEFNHAAQKFYDSAGFRTNYRHVTLDLGEQPLPSD